MRPDIKFGIVISAVVVIVAGTYFFYREAEEKPLPVGEDVGSVADSFLSDGSRKAEPSGKKAVPGTKKPAPSGRVAQPIAHASKGKTKATRTNPQAMAGNKEPASGAKPVPSATSRGRPGRSARIHQGVAGKRISPRSSSPTRSKVAAAKRPVPTTGSKPMAGERTTPSLSSKLVSQAGRRSPARASGSPVLLAAEGSSAAVETHRVQAGETLRMLAEVYYGDARFVEVLKRANPGLDETKALAVGTVVKIPPRPGATKPVVDRRSSKAQRPVRAGSTPSARRTYRVQPGDSLYRIAQRLLGDGGRWKELYALNKSVIGADPAKLRVGQVLVIPPR